MPRVVPSQVVAFIDSVFPATEEIISLHKVDFGQLSGLVDLADLIPDELLTMDGATYASFVCSASLWVKCPCCTSCNTLMRSRSR
jgi:hypothetical protein